MVGPRRAASPSHTYTSNGAFVASVVVSDGTNDRSATVNVDVGTPPQVTITSPVADSLFRSGDVLDFVASATDPDGGPIPNTNYSWTVQFGHEQHFHPELGPAAGPSVSYTVPTTGHTSNETTGIGETVTVTDADGLSTTETVEVYPDEVDLTLQTNPAGLEIRLDGLPTATSRPMTP